MLMLPPLIPVSQKSNNTNNSEIADVSLRNHFTSFPQESYVRSLLKNAFVINQPMEKVGGDGYWIHETDGIVYLVAFDCMGHGRLASIMTRIYISAIKSAIVEEQLSNPATILHAIHNKIEAYFKEKRNTQVGTGADIAVLKLDTQASEVYYSGAKMDLVYSVAGKLERIKGHKKQVGELFGFQRTYETLNVPLTGGAKAVFYLFSDGVTDLFGGPREKKLKYSGLHAILEEVVSEPMERQKALLKAQLNQWSGQFPQTDDLLFIGFVF